MSRDHGLAHLIIGKVYDYDQSYCGLDMTNPSAQRADGEPRCTPCRDLWDGELGRFIY